MPELALSLFKVVEERGGAVAFAGQGSHQFVGWGHIVNGGAFLAIGSPCLFQPGGGANRFAGCLAHQDKVGCFRERFGVGLVKQSLRGVRFGKYG
ncbi:MAG: hypothetical protein FWG74_07375 [Planctomycetes bacterium]|nr:hypothetical protein [Planctomycetota bacterium]